MNSKPSAIDYQDVFEQSPDLTFVCDRNGKILTLNFAAADVFGREPSKLINSNIFEFLPSNMSEKMRTDFLNFVGDMDFETSIPQKEGGAKQIRWRTRLMSNGLIYGFGRLVLQNLAQQKELSEAMGQLTRLIANTPGMVYQFRMTPDGQQSFPFISNKAFEIYEIGPEDFRKDPNIMVTMVHVEDQGELQRRIRQSAQMLTPFIWEGRIQSKSGKTRWIQARSIPSREEDGAILWDGVVIDVTAEKEIERIKLVEQARTVEVARLISLSEVSDRVAHEINNPLAVISGMLHLIPKATQNPTLLSEKITSIQAAVGKIANIVRGLQKFSLKHRMQSKNPIASILLSALDMAQHKSSRTHVELLKDLNVNSMVFCDAVELEEAILNLINNAIDATAQLPEKWVRLNATEESNQIVIQVIDSGNGISADVVRKMFEPFYTTKRQGEGTGLGLCVTRNTIKSLGGSLDYNPNFGHTCFEIRLPISQ